MHYFIAISEDLNLNFSQGSMPPDPLIYSRLRVRISPGPQLKKSTLQALHNWNKFHFYIEGFARFCKDKFLVHYT